MYYLPLITGTSESSGGDTDTLVNTPELSKYADNTFIGAHLYLPGSGLDTDEYRVTDSAQSAGSVDFRPTASAAPNSKAYEILPFSATAIHQAMESALQEAYLQYDMGRETGLTMFLDSPIYNSTFSYWTSNNVVDGWTASGTIAKVLPTATTTGAIQAPLPDPQVLQLSDTGTLKLNVEYERYLYDMRGHTITVYALCYSETASDIRVQLQTDQDGTVSSSSYHSGGGDWEILSVEVSLGEAASSIKPIIDVATGSASTLVAAVWVEGGPAMNQYPIPIAEMPNGPETIWEMPLNHNDSRMLDTRMSGMWPVGDWTINKYITPSNTTTAPEEYGLLTLHERPGSRRRGFRGSSSSAVRGTGFRGRLWAKYKAMYTLVSTDTHYIELDGLDYLLVAKLAARILLSRNPHMLRREEMRARSAELEQEIQDLAQATRGAESMSAPLAPNW